MLVSRILRFLLKQITRATLYLNQIDFDSLLFNMIRKRMAKLSTPETLAFLFRMDSLLYTLQSSTAVEYEPVKHPKHRLTAYHDFFIERIGSNEAVLDFGTGIGAVAYDIAIWTGAIVDGIDINENSIRKAKQERMHERVRFFHGDGRIFNFDRSYDVVVLSNVLEHIDERSTLLRLLKTKTKATKFLIRVPVSDRDWRVFAKRELGIEWRLDLDHKIEYTRESFVAEMNSAGLIINHLEVRWGEIWSEMSAA